MGHILFTAELSSPFSFCRGSTSPLVLLRVLVNHVWVSGNDSPESKRKDGPRYCFRIILIDCNQTENINRDVPAEQGNWHPPSTLFIAESDSFNSSCRRNKATSQGSLYFSLITLSQNTCASLPSHAHGPSIADRRRHSIWSSSHPLFNRCSSCNRPDLWMLSTQCT